MCAKTPLRVVSQWVCATYWADSSLGRNSSEKLLSPCRNLVIVNSQGYFQFAHLSVREFLETKTSFSFADANATAAKSCILLFKASPCCKYFCDNSKVLYENFTLIGPVGFELDFVYCASKHWIAHARSCKDNELLKKFIGTPSEFFVGYNHWLHFHYHSRFTDLTLCSSYSPRLRESL
jgi:hypothetical protein